jgi:hypothetical protein
MRLRLRPRSQITPDTLTVSKRRGPPNSAASIDPIYKLRRETFDDVGAELTDLSGLFIVGSLAPGLGLFEAFKKVDSNSRVLGSSLTICRILTDGDELAARLRNNGSNDRNVFFVVSINVRDINFSHHIDGWLRLRVERSCQLVRHSRGEWAPVVSVASPATSGQEPFRNVASENCGRARSRSAQCA